MSKELTKPEKAEYEERKARLGKSLVEAAEDLRAIRDKKLYRVEFGTFEEFCKQTLGISKSRAYEYIQVADVAANLSAMADVSIVPVNERQMRSLAPLSPNKQQEAWEAARESAGGKQPTAKQVQAAVEVVKAESAPAPAPGKKKSSEVYPCNAVRCVVAAIEQLEKIHPKDQLRAEAFEKLKEWISKNE